MKKTLLSLLLLAGVVLAQENIGAAITIIYDTQGTASVTNYVGFAKTTENTVGTVSTNEPKWKIIRTILDGDGNEVSVQHAYGEKSGDSALWSTAWTNRASATYK